MQVIKEIRCPNCSGPLDIKPGEIIVTCRYCGFTSVIETGKAFSFEHSLLLNRYDPLQVEGLVRGWMERSFVMPPHVAKKSKITEKTLVYLPLWLIVMSAKSHYKGIFERITPPIVKEGDIENKYNWLVLARKASEFPTREYEVPLEGKIPFNFAKIRESEKLLNCEIDQTEAVEKAKREIRDLHVFLAKENVDKIIEIFTDFSEENSIYLHAPIWFVTYEYKGANYRVILDGVSGEVIKGEIPPEEFKLI